MPPNDRKRCCKVNASFWEKSLCFGHGFTAYVSVWVLALVVRAVYTWQIREAPVFTMLLGDAHTYDVWAQQIASGDWLGHSVFYQAPLYPYFLGTLYWLLGRNLLVVRLVQIFVGATSCVLLARAARRYFSKNAGLLAGVVLAVYPTAIFFDCSIQKSVLDLFFVCALLATLGRLLERPEWRWWAVAGSVLGLLALTRENALVLLPVVLAWLFLAWRGVLWTKRLQWAGSFLAGLAVVLLPVACRNLVVGGEFHLTTAQFGPNFYIGNGKGATGVYQELRWGRGTAQFERDDATMLAEQATGRKLRPAEVSHYWAAKAVAEIREDFPRWLRLMGRKWLLVWNVIEVGDSEDQYTSGDWSTLLRVLNRLLHFGTLCPLAALGVCLTWKQRARLWLLYAMILAYAASVALFYVFSRYRFPLVPLLVAFAAAGLTCLRGAIREKQWRAIWAGGAAAVAAAIVSDRAMVTETASRATTHYNIAVNLAEQQAKPEQAILQYAEAVRLMPDFALAHLGLGNLLTRAGRTNDGIREVLQAVQLRPDYPEAHYNLGNALVQVGKPEEAIGPYEQALRLRPDYAEAHHNLGNALRQIGRVQDAIGQYEEALRIKPDYADAHYNLALAFRQVGQLDEAIHHYERAVQIKPDFAMAHYNLGNVLVQTGRVQDGIGHYERALRLNPDYAEAHNNLGVALLQLGRSQEAMGHYEQALRLKPDYAEAHYNMGNALFGLGKVQEAAAQYEQALQLKPDFAEAKAGLARLRAAQ